MSNLRAEPRSLSKRDLIRTQIGGRNLSISVGDAAKATAGISTVTVGAMILSADQAQAAGCVFDVRTNEQAFTSIASKVERGIPQFVPGTDRPEGGISNRHHRLEFEGRTIAESFTSQGDGFGKNDRTGDIITRVNINSSGTKDGTPYAAVIARQLDSNTESGENLVNCTKPGETFRQYTFFFYTEKSQVNKDQIQSGSVVTLPANAKDADEIIRGANQAQPATITPTPTVRTQVVPGGGSPVPSITGLDSESRLKALETQVAKIPTPQPTATPQPVPTQDGAIPGLLLSDQRQDRLIELDNLGLVGALAGILLVGGVAVRKHRAGRVDIQNRREREAIESLRVAAGDEDPMRQLIQRENTLKQRSIEARDALNVVPAPADLETKLETAGQSAVDYITHLDAIAANVKARKAVEAINSARRENANVSPATELIAQENYALRLTREAIRTGDLDDKKTAGRAFAEVERLRAALPAQDKLKKFEDGPLAKERNITTRKRKWKIFKYQYTYAL